MKLVLTEKFSQASDIGSALGMNKTGRGEWRGRGLIMTHAVGHLLEPVEPEKLLPEASWSDPSTLLPVPVKVPLKPVEKTKDRLRAIKDLLREADSVILATDPDREGEGIGRSILGFLRYTGKIERLWLVGGMDKASVEDALRKLKPGHETESMYFAQQGRSRSDWAYMLVTRALTAAGRHGCFGPNLGAGSGKASVVSAGRVQTPTLALIVNRDRAIENFKSVDHFVPWLDLDTPGAITALGYTPIISEDVLGVPTPGVHWQEPERGAAKPKPLFIDKGSVDAFLERLRARQTFSLTVSEKAFKKNPPKPFSLGTLQQHMNKTAGMTVKQTLETAQKLYTDGYLSYPRTEREAYPAELFQEVAPHVHTALKNCSDADIAQAVAALAWPKKRPACYTTKPQEHYALMPTRKLPDLAALPERERKVWLAVTRRWIETHGPVAEGINYYPTVLVDELGLLGEPRARFVGKVEWLHTLGWTALFDAKAPAPKPALMAGEFPASRVYAKAQKTQPPKPYSEASLLADMKACGKYAKDQDAAQRLKAVTGIGTPATRDAIIETLLSRQYIQRKGKTLRSTPPGRDLIDHVPNHLKEVDTTADWEQVLADIEGMPPSEGAHARDAFLLAQAQIAGEIIVFCQTKMAEMPRRAYTPPAGGKGKKGKGKKGRDGSPTPKMVETVESVAQKRGVALPDNYKTSFDACRGFLDTHLGGRS